MRRHTFDKLMTTAGVVAAAGLLIAGALLWWGASFANSNVSDRLRPQNIKFPTAEKLTPEERAIPGVEKYAGQQVVNGDQAKVYSDYIGLHLQKVNGGKTYSETSTESRANPDDQALAGKVQTLFRGETLRAILLNAYGWWFVGNIALYGALAAFAGAAIMTVLVVLGFMHLRRVRETEVFDPPRSVGTVKDTDSVRKVSPVAV